MKILAFAASNSRQSINKQLVTYATSLLNDAQVELLDLNDFEMPIYSADRETQSGIPSLAQQFFDKIGSVDGLLISYAEHNGSYTAAFKNIYDWASRIDSKVFQNKSMVLLSTSPGPGGAGSVLTTAKASAPFFGGNIKGSLSVPSFYDNFDMETGKITNLEIESELKNVVPELMG